MASDNDEKQALKNLEKALAQELDHQVVLTQPSDIRLSDEIDLNPSISSIKTPKSALAPSEKIIVKGAAEKNENDAIKISGGESLEEDPGMTLEDLDRIMDEQGPEFRKALSDMQDEVKKVADGKAMSDSDTQLSQWQMADLEKLIIEDENSEKNSVGKPKKNLIFSVANAKKVYAQARDWIEHFPEKSKKFKKEIIPTFKKISKYLWGRFSEIGQAILEKMSEIWSDFYNLEFIYKSLLLLILLLIVGLYYLLQTLRQGHLLPDSQIASLVGPGQVSSQIHEIKSEEEWSAFSDPTNQPEFVMILSRIVVNIRPSENSSANPMAVFEFIIQTNNQDGAVEMKKRISEVRDLVSRTSEEITYDDLVTPEGKEKLKMILRKDINQILNTGRVTKIFYKSVVIKP